MNYEMIKMASKAKALRTAGKAILGAGALTGAAYGGKKALDSKKAKDERGGLAWDPSYTSIKNFVPELVDVGNKFGRYKYDRAQARPKSNTANRLVDAAANAEMGRQRADQVREGDREYAREVAAKNLQFAQGSRIPKDTLRTRIQGSTPSMKDVGVRASDEVQRQRDERGSGGPAIDRMRQLVDTARLGRS